MASMPSGSGSFSVGSANMGRTVCFTLFSDKVDTPSLDVLGQSDLLREQRRLKKRRTMPSPWPLEGSRYVPRPPS